MAAPETNPSASAANAICVGVEEAARRLGVSEWTCRAWLANGTIPVVRFPSVDGQGVNRRILVRVADLEAFAAGHVERAS